MNRLIKFIALFLIIGVFSNLCACNIIEGETSSKNTQDESSYKLYYIVDSDKVGIIGFDDRMSSSNISTMQAEIEKAGYSVEYVEFRGKNDVIIPDSIEGYSVFAIDGAAFNGCASIKSIDIPSSVQIIEPGAFEKCASDMIIHGESGSAAEESAKENNISFEIKQ